MQFVLAFLAALLAAVFSTAAPTLDVSADVAGAVAVSLRADQQGACSAGPTHCCSNVINATNASPNTTALLGLLGVDLSDALNNVGVGCSSLVGGTSCTAKTLCCQNQTFDGLINIGCTDIGVGL